MEIPFVRPSLLADPPPAPGVTVLRDATLFDGTGSPPRPGTTVVIEDGRISLVTDQGVDAPSGARVYDLDGKFLMPGLIDCHSHVAAEHDRLLPEGVERMRPGVAGHLAAASLRSALAMGVTTIRDVGSFDDAAFELRQAMRYGAFRGPRLLTCGRIVSATSPGGSHFHSMYRQADGPDEMRKAAREQIRAGADFVKIMMTGARSVELENPGPSQVTSEEVAAVVDESHRQGYRVAAHCEGLEGTRLAVEHGVDTIEHGLFLHRAPELLADMARQGTALIPTLSFLVDVAERRADEWSPHLVARGTHNLDEARQTLVSAVAAGVTVAMGYDSAPEERAASELGLMVDAGMAPADCLVSATSAAAEAIGLSDVIGTVEVGKLADLLLIDGDPIADVGVLVEPDRIDLVLQIGEPVAGRSMPRR